MLGARREDRLRDRAERIAPLAGRAETMVMDVAVEAQVTHSLNARSRVWRPRHHDLQRRLRLLRHRRTNDGRDDAADDGRQLHGDVLTAPGLRSPSSGRRAAVIS